MATYNGALHIEKQLASILKNLEDNDEVVVSDDNSSDETIAIVNGFNDDRIRVVLNHVDNRGHITNFENALKHASGEYLFLSDQDDIWHDNKVELMMSALEEHDLVVCDCTIVDGEMKLLNDSFYDLLSSGSGLVKNLVKNTYLGCCMAFNREVLEKALPFPSDIISHDTWLGLMGELTGSCIFIPEKLQYFIRHGTNFSITDGQDAMNDQISPYSFGEKMRMRLILLKNVIKRRLR
jgi:glycosyltransferase involved in cell wall biosynthesis